MENSLKSLVIDDDFVSRESLRGLLERFGVSDSAIHGEEGVLQFRKALGQGEAYQLVALDILMAGLDGRDVVRFIREAEKAAGIGTDSCARFIIISTLGSLSGQQELFKTIEPSVVLPKPFSTESLQQALQQLGLL